jgi:fatty-acyl-CoA synthase
MPLGGGVDEHDAVVEAAVIGRPDRRWGEVPVAYVVLAEGRGDARDELEAHCSARLARFKVPKSFHVIDALSRNPTGKVLKRDLRERERVETGGEDPAPEAARA